MGMNNNGVPGGDYARKADAYFSGMELDTRYSTKESLISSESGDLHFGAGVVGGGKVGTGRLPRLNRKTLTGNTDLVTGNSTVVTLNGVALDAVDFDTDHDTTMLAIAAVIAADSRVKSVTVSAARALQVTLNDEDITITAETTGGSGQPTWTPGTASTTDSAKGVAMYQAREGTVPTPAQPSQAIPFQNHQPFTVMADGVVAGLLSSEAGDLVDEQSIYIVVAAGANRGKLTNNSTTGGVNNILVGKLDLDHDGVDADGAQFAGQTSGLIPVRVNL